MQVDRGVVGAVVGGEHHRIPAGQHPVAVQVGAGRAGEHDAGPVVVGEHHGPLMGPGGDHDGLRAKSPDPLPGKVFRCLRAEVVGAPLEGEHETVVVAAERGGALQVQYVGVAGQFGGRGANPLVRGNAVEGLGGGQQRPTGLGLLVDQRNPGSGPGRVQGGGQAGRTGADHEHVHVVVHGVVAGGVGVQAQPPLAGDAARDEPVVQLDGGGQHHGFGVGMLDLHQPAGVLGPGGGDAPRSAKFDAGGDLLLAGGQQGRSQGVTGVTGEVLAVEGEIEGGAAVDASAVGVR